MEYKICRICGINKPITEYRKQYNKRFNKYYYRTECHDCEILKNREYEKKRKDRTEYIKKHNKEYREKNKQFVKDLNAKWREKNKDLIKEKRKEEYKQNKDKILKRQKDYYEKNKEDILEYHHKYNKDNSKILVEKATKYRKSRKETDEFYRFKLLLRDCIKKSFTRTNHRKTSYSKEIIGTDFETAWNYLKETWRKNYGTEYNGEPYHIDHVKPLATAKTKEDVIKLCHYTNLQMLKPKDNLNKSDKTNWHLKNKD